MKNMKVLSAVVCLIGVAGNLIVQYVEGGRFLLLLTAFAGTVGLVVFFVLTVWVGLSKLVEKVGGESSISLYKDLYGKGKK